MPDLTLLNQGRTAEIFEYGEDQILKLFRPGFPITAIEQEYKTALVINNLQLGPQFFGETIVDGRMGLIYERIHGRSMMVELIAKPWKMFAYLKQFTDIQIKMHSLEGNLLANQKATLRRKILRTDLLKNQEKQYIIGLLETLEEKNRLCHGDYHLDNILLSAKGPKVIDWMTATSGDPAADFIRTLILFKYGDLPRQKPLLQRVLSRIFRGFLSHIYTYYFLKKEKIPKWELKQWELPIMAARLEEYISESESAVLLHRIHKCIQKNGHFFESA